jgi:hypothetical protein
VSDEQLFVLAVHRLAQRHGGKTTLQIPISAWVAVIANLQLAMRHPGNQGEARQLAREFIDQSIDAIQKEEPELAMLLRRGDDPAHDVGKVGP